MKNLLELIRELFSQPEELVRFANKADRAYTLAMPQFGEHTDFDWQSNPTLVRRNIMPLLAVFKYLELVSLLNGDTMEALKQLAREDKRDYSLVCLMANTTWAASMSFVAKSVEVTLDIMPEGRSSRVNVFTELDHATKELDWIVSAAIARALCEHFNISLD